MRSRKSQCNVIPAKAGIDPRFREDDNGGKRDFLLEIGCEELPADYLPGALGWGEQEWGLAVSAAACFSQDKVCYKEIRTYGTPRRLVLLVRGVKPEIQRVEKGPPLQIAFDAAGKPTRAAEAFAQRHRMKVSQLKRRDSPKGGCLYAEYSVPAEKVLSKGIPGILQGIGFPKSMRWDESGVRFARPVRWLLALHGSKPVPAAFGKVAGGRVTYGTRRGGSKPLSIKDPAAYFNTLDRLGVQLEEGQPYKSKGDSFEPILPFQPRKRDALLKRLRAAAKRCKGRIADEKTEEFNWLLNTVAFLAENPVVEIGSFRKEYLDLPAEVLATAMAKHLKLFSVHAPDGKRMLPRFLAVLEGEPDKPATVVANIERILEARFTDARFFYREDTKHPLEARAPELAKVVFHEKMGAVADRIPRMERLMRAAAHALSLEEPAAEALRRAALLAKADLVTQMVREFPSLQGVIGAHYAGHDGEPPEVAQALAEQYRPRAADDPVPSTPLGALLGLADRLDTLIGYFGVGLKPTGSLDPYALRRQAMGLVRILIEPPPGLSFLGLSIDRLFDEGIQSWGPRFTAEPSSVKTELRAFLRERFEWLASVRHRMEREMIAAALEAGIDDVSGCWERLNVLQQLWKDPRKRPALIQAAKVAERTGRIVKAAKPSDGLGAVKPEVFKEPPERKLWELWSRLALELKEQIRQRRYAEAVAAYSALYPAVHEFFETVFVMDEDPEIRRNRLAFMNEIFGALSGCFADLSKLPLSGIEPA